MTDSSWGVRVSQETKEYVQQLIAGSGLSAREFFEQLLSVWVANESGIPSSLKNKETRELEHLLSRIASLFSEVLFRERSKVEKFSEELGIQQEEINKLRVGNEKLILEKEEIVTKLKDQIATLNEMLVRYQGYEIINRDLETSVAELTNIVKDSTAECDRLKAQIASMRDRHKNGEAQLKKQAEQELELLAEKKDLQNEREMLRIRLDYEAKLEAMNEKYTSIIQGFPDIKKMS